MAARLDQHDLHGKANYYAPVLTALSLASPLYRGDLWRIRGRIGKSVRTHHRSTIAPAISIHPKESLRLEFKPFEMSRSLSNHHCYFLLWLALIVDEKLEGRATEQTRIYDMGQIAQSGLEAETVRARAHEVLTRAPAARAPWGSIARPCAVWSNAWRRGALRPTRSSRRSSGKIDSGRPAQSGRVGSLIMFPTRRRGDPAAADAADR